MRRSPIILPLALLSGLLAAALSAAPPPQSTPPPQRAILAPTALPTISLQEVRAGQRGYGLSVFAGGSPERFEVEVVGVMRNVTPDNSYILARLTGKGLEKSGVIAGMSGSPVFLDGRLAGAVAFSWPFSHEAIAGITPIESMRRLSGPGRGGPDSPLPPPAPPLPPVGVSDIAAGRVPADLLARQLAALRPAMAGGAVPSIQWSTSGFGEQSMGLLRQALGNVAAGGRSPSRSAGAIGGSGGSGKPAAGSLDAAALVPGGSVSAVLIDGDFSLAATGTVTDRIGDQVYAFGHPFLGLGPTRVPMATSEVVTVLSSQYTSFKIANVGDVVGAFEQDRQAGIAGRLGAAAPMVPMVLRIRGRDPREFHLRLAEVPQLMALLVGSATLAALDSASYSAGPQGLDLTARFRLAGHGDLEVRQSFDGDNAGTEAAANVLAVAGYLSQNPLERVEIQSIDVDLEQSAQPRSATLVGAHADHTVVRPGERVTLNLDLLPYRGERLRHTLSVRLPEDLPDGPYALLVGDGASADAARLSIAPAEPVSFEQALTLLRSFHSRREVAVLGVFGGAGLSVAGEAMPRLPASIRSLWGAAASGSAVPLRLAIAQEHREPMPIPVQGLVRIELEVRRRDARGAGHAAKPGKAGSEAPAAPGRRGGSAEPIDNGEGGEV